MNEELVLLESIRGLLLKTKIGCPVGVERAFDGATTLRQAYDNAVDRDIHSVGYQLLRARNPGEEIPPLCPYCQDGSGGAIFTTGRNIREIFPYEFLLNLCQEIINRDGMESTK